MRAGDNSASALSNRSPSFIVSRLRHIGDGLVFARTYRLSRPRVVAGELLKVPFLPGGRQVPLADLGSGLIDQSQKMTVAAMQMADMNVWAHRS